MVITKQSVNIDMTYVCLGLVYLLLVCVYVNRWFQSKYHHYVYCSNWSGTYKVIWRKLC